MHDQDQPLLPFALDQAKINERDRAIKIASAWLDFNMNPLTQMVHGDADCDACILARQYLMAMVQIKQMDKVLGALNRATQSLQRMTETVNTIKQRTTAIGDILEHKP